MADTYTTHNVFLRSADTNILIVQFPDEDVNDKLTLLAAERGLIYRSFYEDFVIGICMSSSGPFFYHIRKRPELLSKYTEIRKEILELVYQYSPAFKPENIVINQNNVLKTKSTIRKDEKTRPLTDNELWEQEPPLSNFGPAVITNAPSKDDVVPTLDGDDIPPPFILDNPFDEGDEIEDVNVPYELMAHHWVRMGLYISIRKYEESDENLVDLIGGSPFDTEEGYHLLVVERCVEDYAAVLQLLDQMGATQHATPQQIMAEMYNMILTYNPMLRTGSFDMKQIRRAYREKQKKGNNSANRRTAQAGADAKKTPTSSQKKRFADISKEKLRGLYDEMKKRIIGQDDAVQNVVDAVQRAAIGLKREHEPLGVFLFTGNSGCGKTETSKALASCLEAHLARIDCSEYQQPHEVAKLAGSPPGYVAYDDGGHLTKEISKYPFSVVLFDEVEKAHSAFHERLLQIIDDGVLTDNKGNRVSFKDTIIIMTSNIGVKEVSSISKTLGFGAASALTDQKAGKARGEALKHKFKPEFINRIDEVINFRRLEKEDYLKILNILLAEVSGQIQKSQEINLTFTQGAKELLLDKGIDPKYGARPLRRAVKKYLNTPLARAILNEELASKSRVSVSLSPEKDALIFKPAKKIKKVAEA